jgi:hypothetical protein
MSLTEWQTSGWGTPPDWQPAQWAASCPKHSRAVASWEDEVERGSITSIRSLFTLKERHLHRVDRIGLFLLLVSSTIHTNKQKQKAVNYIAIESERSSRNGPKEEAV